jgi:N6-adenosine-specific RNA methylase IME4
MHLVSPHDAAAVRCIVADPPWRFGDALGRRGAAANYRTLSVDQIAWHTTYRAIVTAPRNAVLFLWRVSSMQREAIALLDSWGFQLKSEIVWEKTTVKGLDHFGMGYIVRAAHETCLIATRGRVPVKHHSQRSRFRAPVGRHSQKPEAFFDIVEGLYDGPYVELFARRQRPGWACLGLEARKGDTRGQGRRARGVAAVDARVGNAHGDFA